MPRSLTTTTTTTQTSNLTISSFDNARFSMTASQTVEIIPATNESDFGVIILDTTVNAADSVDISANSGTNYVDTVAQVGAADMGGTVGSSSFIHGVGNSTGRYRVTTVATVGTRQFQRCITTLGLLA